MHYVWGIGQLAARRWPDRVKEHNVDPDHFVMSTKLISVIDPNPAGAANRGLTRLQIIYTNGTIPLPKSNQNAHIEPVFEAGLWR